MIDSMRSYKLIISSLVDMRETYLYICDIYSMGDLQDPKMEVR